MPRTVRDVLRIAGYAAIVLLVVATAVIIALEVFKPIADNDKRLAFELDIVKTLLAGFVVGGLGVLIPAMVTEARNRFEQRKESRAAYSEAKTRIDYLKLRLATLSLAEAAEALQKAHYHKHQAELFEELPQWLRMRWSKDDDEANEKRWDEFTYDRLFAARQILEAEADNWRQLSPKERIVLLDGALPTVSEAGKKPEA